jgi:hypothetical protein
VEVIILERSHSVSKGESPSQVEKVVNQTEPNLCPLRGTVLFYEETFEPA